MDGLPRFGELNDYSPRSAKLEPRTNESILAAIAAVGAIVINRDFRMYNYFSITVFDLLYKSRGNEFSQR